MPLTFDDKPLVIEFESGPPLRDFFQQWYNVVAAQRSSNDAAQQPIPQIDASECDTVDVPPGLTSDEIVAFVREAIAARGGDPNTAVLLRYGALDTPVVNGMPITVTTTFCYEKID